MRSTYIQSWLLLLALALTSCQSDRAMVTASRGGGLGFDQNNSKQLSSVNAANNNGTNLSVDGNSNLQRSSNPGDTKVDGNNGVTSLQSEADILSQLQDEDKAYDRFVSVLSGTYYVTTLDDDAVAKLGSLLSADDIEIIKGDKGRVDKETGELINRSVLEQLQHLLTQDFSDDQTRKDRLKELIDSYKVLETGLDNVNQPHANAWYIDAYMLYIALEDAIAELSQETVNADHIKSIVSPLALGRDIALIEGQASEIQMVSGRAGASDDDTDPAPATMMSAGMKAIYCTLKHEFEKAKDPATTFDYADCLVQDHALTAFTTLTEEHKSQACNKPETLQVATKYAGWFTNPATFKDNDLNSAERVLLNAYAEAINDLACSKTDPDPAPLDPNAVSGIFKNVYCVLKADFAKAENASIDVRATINTCLSQTINHAMFEVMTQQHAAKYCDYPAALEQARQKANWLKRPGTFTEGQITLKEQGLINAYADAILGLACTKFTSDDDTDLSDDPVDTNTVNGQITLLVRAVDGTPISSDKKTETLAPHVKGLLTTYSSAQFSGVHTLDDAQKQIFLLRKGTPEDRNTIKVLHTHFSIAKLVISRPIKPVCFCDLLNGEDVSAAPFAKVNLTNDLKKVFKAQRLEGKKIKTLGRSHYLVRKCV
ncbi:MAG: hypothetical protein R3A45_05760 [Bdellovibrionota bacterium]